MTGAETLAACRREGVAVTRGPGGRLTYCPVPSPEVLGALRFNREAIVQILEATEGSGEPLAPDAFDPHVEAVRVEYEEDGISVGFWIVPDHCTAALIENEPAVRRRDLSKVFGLEAGALRRTLFVLRAFPGAKIRSVGSATGVES